MPFGPPLIKINGLGFFNPARYMKEHVALGVAIGVVLVAGILAVMRPLFSHRRVCALGQFGVLVIKSWSVSFCLRPHRRHWWLGSAHAGVLECFFCLRFVLPASARGYLTSGQAKLGSWQEPTFIPGHASKYQLRESICSALKDSHSPRARGWGQVLPLL